MLSLPVAALTTVRWSMDGVLPGWTFGSGRVVVPLEKRCAGKNASIGADFPHANARLASAQRASLHLEQSINKASYDMALHTPHLPY